MKVRLRLPPEIRDVWCEGGKLYILVPDAALVASSKNPKVFTEIIRWTGAQLQSISSYNDEVIIGTDRGAVIVINGKPYPMWTGAPSLVVADKLSSRHRFFILAEKIEQNIVTPNLLVPYMVSKEELKTSKKATSRVFGEITLFPASTTPFKDDVVRVAKRLITTMDVDKDGYKEVFVASVEENKAQISLIKLTGDDVIVASKPFITHVATYPVSLDVGDIDADGLEEPILLLRRRDNFFHHILATLAVSFEKNDIDIYPIMLGELNLKKLITDAIEDSAEDITDDVETFLLAGNVDDDSFPEVFILVYTPPVEDSSKLGKIYPIKISFNGKINVGKPFEVVPLKNVIVVDIDNDNRKEAVVVTHSGFSVIKLSADANYEKRDHHLPAVMRFFVERKNDFTVAGPIFVGMNVYSVINLADEKIEFIGNYDVISARRGVNKFILLIRDSEKKLEGLAVFDDKGVTRVDIGSIKVENFFVYGKNIIVYSNGKHYILENEHIKELRNSSVMLNKATIEIVEKSRVIKLGDNTISLKKGNKQLTYSLEYSLDDILVIPNTGVLIKERTGELYFLNFNNGKLSKSELSNIVGMNFVNDILQLSFENNWIVDYKLSEVFQ